MLYENLLLEISDTVKTEPIIFLQDSQRLAFKYDIDACYGNVKIVIM